MPELKITPRDLYESHRWIPLDEVEQLPGNPNVGADAALQKSLDEFGWIDGIVIHEGVIIAGNHRFKQAIAAEEEGLPGYDLSRFDIDSARRMAMAIAHNRTNRKGADDPLLLSAALEELPDGMIETLDYTEFDVDRVRAVAAQMREPDFLADLAEGVDLTEESDVKRHPDADDTVELRFTMTPEERTELLRILRTLQSQHEMETLTHALLHVARSFTDD